MLDRERRPSPRVGDFPLDAHYLSTSRKARAVTRLWTLIPYW